MLKTKEIKTVLVLAPHTDDGEFGCGGTIARFLEEGKEVHYAAFSACEDSVPSDFPKDILKKELRQAMKVLGVKRESIHIYEYQVRTFPQRRQEILDDLIALREDIKPDLVFLPSQQDIHQDHHTIAMEGLRAFRYVSILGYEVPWNNISFNTLSFVLLKDKHLERKIKALGAYKSQAFRNYANEQFIRSLAITRGTQIASVYAEAFEVIRWVIK